MKRVVKHSDPQTLDRLLSILEKCKLYIIRDKKGGCEEAVSFVCLQRGVSTKQLEI